MELRYFAVMALSLVHVNAFANLCEDVLAGPDYVAAAIAHAKAVVASAEKIRRGIGEIPVHDSRDVYRNDLLGPPEGSSDVRLLPQGRRRILSSVRALPVSARFSYVVERLYEDHQGGRSWRPIGSFKNVTADELLSALEQKTAPENSWGVDRISQITYEIPGGDPARADQMKADAISGLLQKANQLREPRAGRLARSTESGDSYLALGHPRPPADSVDAADVIYEGPIHQQVQELAAQGARFHYQVYQLERDNSGQEGWLNYSFNMGSLTMDQLISDVRGNSSPSGQRAFFAGLARVFKVGYSVPGDADAAAMLEHAAKLLAEAGKPE